MPSTVAPARCRPTANSNQFGGKCGDRKTMFIGGAECGGSSAFARLPDLLDGPLLRPFGGDKAPVGRRLGSRPHFGQVLDLEAVGTQQPDPVAIAQVKVDRGRVGPFEAVQAEVGSSETVACRPVGLD